ncbi:MAG: hypothetical protein HY245_15250 [Rhizobiales bacterium]|nr:hypothetical protein [Hyphomicrobiales bacterium]MBI3674744.1 hypothetical protein [Hyphomicrobiales bacterium]
MSITERRSGFLSRRAVMAGAAMAATGMIGRVEAEAGARLYRQPRDKAYPLYDEATANVIPPAGYQSRIALGGSIVKLVRNGVISPDKFRQLEKFNGKMPEELATVLEKPSGGPIRLTQENAFHYVNLLWPVGLSNRLDANKESPIAGPDLPGFASTGGWNLGMAPEGSVYFNKFPIIQLKPEAETLGVRVAKSTYRPCCNNSTFFQDCNHGSALFAVLQLGAAQGLNEEQLYKEALAFNSFWFPDYYIRTALYFKVVRKTEWRDVDARTITGPGFSAGGPWQQNVLAPLVAYPDLIPQPAGGANCGT